MLLALTNACIKFLLGIRVYSVIIEEYANLDWKNQGKYLEYS